jgi:hypothetical protein
MLEVTDQGASGGIMEVEGADIFRDELIARYWKYRLGFDETWRHKVEHK